MESDTEFLFRFAMDFDFGESEDLARLFALARRGAAVQWVKDLADSLMEAEGKIGVKNARIEQLETALRDVLSKSCDAFYEMANMLDDEDFSGEVPGRSGTLIGHREEYHKYMVEALTKAGDAAREALTAMEQRT